MPEIIVHQEDVAAHGISISADDNTACVARGQNSNGFEVYDVSSLQSREADPRMEHVSKLTWNHTSVPQSAIPVVIDGTSFVIESDVRLTDDAWPGAPAR